MVSIFHRAAPSQMLVREAPGVARLLTRDPISLRGLSLAFAIVVVSPLSAARAQAIPAAGAGGEQRHTQLEPGSRSLDSLVAHALEVNPAIHAAAARVTLNRAIALDPSNRQVIAIDRKLKKGGN